MNIEKLKNGIWVPSTDAQIDEWRAKGSPFVQNNCLKQFVDWCRSQNKKFNKIVDIGAWCGTWAMVMQAHANNIYCFEPNKIHYECLQRNVAPYNHVRTYNQAIGNEDGHIALSEEYSTQNTRVLLQKGDTKISKLDSLEINDIDMIKIDVEGLEMEVLKGASHQLEKIKYIMIELNNNSKRYGSSNLEIEKHLKDLGYKILIKTWPDIVYYKV